VSEVKIAGHGFRSTFILATLALYVLRRLGFSGCPVRLESDSISALGWAGKGTARRGRKVNNVSKVFCLAWAN